MSPTKLLIQTVVVVVLAAPSVLAESGVPSAMDEHVEAAAAPGEPEGEETSTALRDEASAQPMAPESASDAFGGGEGEPEEMVSPEPEPESDSVPADWQGGQASPPLRTAGATAPAPHQSGLGAIGYDSQGRRGRIHIVVPRDTLWDISNAYLGTPWVWPSIWRDNDDSIENPHLIYPGDHIWITPNEMRRVTPEEAAMLLANRPVEPEMPAAAEDAAPLPAEPTPELLTEPVDRGSVRVSSRETAGLISPEQLEASGSIVDRVPERVLMSQEDDVWIGLGEGEVEPGDQLTIFRTNMKVFDPDTGRLLGYHVDFLGWLEVTETHPETSRARIGMSTGEVEVTDRLMPREPLPAEIPVQASPGDVEGKISFFPNKRVLMGYNDFVYLNRGTLDGLEVGSPLEVYRPGRTANETTRDEEVQVPDLVIAEMLVVRVEGESAVALVTRSNTELELGDHFRGAR